MYIGFSNSVKKAYSAHVKKTKQDRLRQLKSSERQQEHQILQFEDDDGSLLDYDDASLFIDSEEFLQRSYTYSNL